jgi:hypothetical protein
VALGRRDVRDDPDGWVPPVGESVREGEVGVGRQYLMGRGRIVGRKLSRLRKDKEKEGGREREGLVSFFLKTHKLKQKHATTSDAQALG